MTLIIKATALISTIIREGRVITVKYATKTDKWDRAYLANEIQEKFVKSVQARAFIDPRICEIVMAESVHTNPLDMRDHFTAQGNDVQGGFVSTFHVVPVPE
ncbi:hypothetical protein GGR51DRAFT_570189 [Nemania sp. FL0031]|nr:hypothetical protein GGR51DRAFT_570189 [Nemania sp. FL0031]